MKQKNRTQLKKQITKLVKWTLMTIAGGIIAGIWQTDFIQNMLYKPDIQLVKKQTIRTGEEVFTEFYIVNKGNKSANNIMLMIKGLPADKFKIFPYIDYEYTQYSKTAGQKESFIKLKSLLPYESTSIIVVSKQNEFEHTEKEFKDHDFEFNWPEIVLTRSDENKITNI